MSTVASTLNPSEVVPVKSLTENVQEPQVRIVLDNLPVQSGKVRKTNVIRYVRDGIQFTVPENPSQSKPKTSKLKARRKGKHFGVVTLDGIRHVVYAQGLLANSINMLRDKFLGKDVEILKEFNHSLYELREQELGGTEILWATNPFGCKREDVVF